MGRVRDRSHSCIQSLLQLTGLTDRVRRVQVHAGHTEDSNQVQNWRLQRKNDNFSFFLFASFLTSPIFLRTREKRKFLVHCSNTITLRNNCAAGLSSVNHTENYSISKEATLSTAHLPPFQAAQAMLLPCVSEEIRRKAAGEQQ